MKNEGTIIRIADEKIISKIHFIRDQRVILDRDLAAFYDIDTKVLKQAVRRNMKRFPKDFMFEMNTKEFENWRSQFVTSKSDKVGLRYAPFCFTEYGVVMMASVLNSQKAIKANIAIVRAFIALREMIMNNKELTQKIIELEKRYDIQFSEIFEALKILVVKKQTQDEFAKRERIGFKPRGINNNK